MQNSNDNFEKGILKKFNEHINMTYHHLSQRFKISAQNERLVRLIFPKQFAQILGLDPTLVEKPIGNGENVFKFNAKLNHNFSNFYVYSDIASFTFIGDTVAPVLRVVPFQSNALCFCFKIYCRPSAHYIKNRKWYDCSFCKRQNDFKITLS